MPSYTNGGKYQISVSFEIVLVDLNATALCADMKCIYLCLKSRDLRIAANVCTCMAVLVYMTSCAG